MCADRGHVCTEEDGNSVSALCIEQMAIMITSRAHVIQLVRRSAGENPIQKRGRCDAQETRGHCQKAPRRAVAKLLLRGHNALYGHGLCCVTAPRDWEIVFCCDPLAAHSGPGPRTRTENARPHPRGALQQRSKQASRARKTCGFNAAAIVGDLDYE